MIEIGGLCTQSVGIPLSPVKRKCVWEGLRKCAFIKVSENVITLLVGTEARKSNDLLQHRSASWSGHRNPAHDSNLLSQLLLVHSSISEYSYQFENIHHPFLASPPASFLSPSRVSFHTVSHTKTVCFKKPLVKLFSIKTYAQ